MTHTIVKMFGVGKLFFLSFRKITFIIIIIIISIENGCAATYIYI